MNVTQFVALPSPSHPTIAGVPHARLFIFESDFVASMRCIPMAVRFKLDRVEIKLTLRQWSRFSRADRERLLLRPCHTDREVALWRALLLQLIRIRAGEEARILPPITETPWADTDQIAPEVAAFATSHGVAAPTAAQWADLSDLERFALVKLSRDNHDNVNFLPALAELISGLSSRKAPTRSHHSATRPDPRGSRRAGAP